jgi:hypothetical protein
MSGLKIAFGTLHDILSRPVASDGFTFVAALVYHPGASVWLIDACDHGEFQFGETNEDPFEPEND